MSPRQGFSHRWGVYIRVFSHEASLISWTHNCMFSQSQDCDSISTHLSVFMKKKEEEFSYLSQVYQCLKLVGNLIKESLVWIHRWIYTEWSLRPQLYMKLPKIASEFWGCSTAVNISNFALCWRYDILLSWKTWFKPFPIREARFGGLFPDLQCYVHRTAGVQCVSKWCLWIHPKAKETRLQPTLLVNCAA